MFWRPLVCRDPWPSDHQFRKVLLQVPERQDRAPSGSVDSVALPPAFDVLHLLWAEVVDALVDAAASKPAPLVVKWPLGAEEALATFGAAPVAIGACLSFGIVLEGKPWFCLLGHYIALLVRLAYEYKTSLLRQKKISLNSQKVNPDHPGVSFSAGLVPTIV